ncbi:hypothetical protein B0I35DRAFT_243254 [Stachybotrys elegans]|uniref:ATP-dependent DNA ligase family profile domain-containing protein n=1 Tax=Stachybotrys elegans TaxID=80388 RepID=A0A8K0SM63_9HYPO|nr:hypothetical protein B0I35DRAFT_243254 [Stachybotrys elegans]
MPLPFSFVCELLEESLRHSGGDKEKKSQVVSNWFARYRISIDAHDTNIAALLSTLLPETRTDRVYCIQAASLEKVVGRALMLGSSRIAELAIYKSPGLDFDLADCVERILTATPNPSSTAMAQVTVEEIDNVLHSLAAQIRWSSPSIRASQTTLTSGNRRQLEGLYRVLTPKEAKWFTRLVLKDYRPVVFDPQLIYRLCDPLLPSVMNIQQDFTAAIQLVQAVRERLLSHAGRTAVSRQDILRTIKPKIGIKVGRQHWFKARSIKHCLDMGSGRMSVESKLDGEYCQIHVDPSKGAGAIQIFSKSGKDSTEDRHAVISSISESLRLGQPDCQIHEACILEGELVVYSDLEKKILPFYKIRKYVSRRGRFLGTEQDSQPRHYEKLMIVYFDILLLDDRSLLDVCHSDRFKLLEQVVRRTPGRSDVVQRQVINFDQRLAASDLRKLFAKTIINKNEGLVLKPDGPYFNSGDPRQSRGGYCIKLKKEYIGNFGDVGDFAVVGAGYDPAKARTYRIPNLKWTHFFIGCLTNKEECRRWGATPKVTVVSIVELSETQMKAFLSFCNPLPVSQEDNKAIILTMTPGIRMNVSLATTFAKPPVFDMRCFGFDKEGNTGFWSLRFPSVTKIHLDRDFLDTVSFEELQSMAVAETTAPEVEDSQEDLAWIARLEGADPRATAVDAASQLTASTIPTPSPSKSSQTWNHSAQCAWGVDRARASTKEPFNPESLESRQLPSDPSKIPITNPTSLPLESAEATAHKHRHETHVASGTSLNRKRVVSPQNGAATVAQSMCAQQDPKKRRKLDAIDGNASQRPTRSLPSGSQQNPTDGRIVIDLTTPDVSFNAALKADPIQKENAAPCDEKETVAMNSASTGQADTEPSQVLPTSTSSKDIHSVPPAPELKPGTQKLCAYAGTKCQLGRFKTIAPSGLLTNFGEITSLLADHGVAEVFTSLDKWMESSTKQPSSPTRTASGCQTVLLIDSVNYKLESRKFLRETEQQRFQTQDSQRAWIDVYDWRILNDLAVLEDTNITAKYFGGFTDPWRRWYCGLI